MRSTGVCGRATADVTQRAVDASGSLTRDTVDPPGSGPLALGQGLLTRIGDSAGAFSALRWMALVMPLLIFLTMAGWSWRANQREVEDRLSRTVDMLHEHTARAFDAQLATLEAVDQRIQDLDWPAITLSADVHRFLAAMSANARPSGGLLLVDATGRVRSGSAVFPGDGRDVGDRDYFIAHRDGKTGASPIHLGEVVNTRPFGYAAFTLSRPRRNRGATGFDGVIVTALKSDYFEDFYRSVAENPNDVLALVRDDGAFLARAPASVSAAAAQGGNGTPRPQLGLIAQAREQGRLYASATSSVDGISRTYLVRRLDDYPAFVVYGLEDRAIWNAWLRDIAAYGVICVAAALMLTVLTRRAEDAARRERMALAAAHDEAERRAEAEARLRHSQRVDALGRMVGGVAHDFRNIVMAVQAGSRSIQRQADDPEAVRRLAEMTEKTAERAARLTNRMVAFARSDENRTTSTDVVPSLESVVEMLSHTLGPGYRIAARLPRSLPPIQGDETEFETVVINLVINARDAMPKGGTVTIEAGPATTADGDQAVTVSVRDHGVGMDEATLARAGEAFFTTKPVGQGTGLGLAMARSFAAQSGGTLNLDSRPNEGTTATLTLALFRPEADEAA